jgi:hypothetical protein
MPDKATYIAIATYTVTSTDTTITFNSIPSTYTDLRLIASEKYTSSTNCYIRFNNDSTSKYSKISCYGGTTYAGTLASAKNSNQTESYIHAGNGTASIPKYTEMDIYNYLATSDFKPYHFREGNPDDYFGFTVGLYRGTSAISRIDLTVYQSSWSAGSVFTLYGILRNT